MVLKPDFEARVLEGQARIRLKADQQSPRFIELNAPGLQMAVVTLDGQAVELERSSTGWRIGLGEAQAAATEVWLEVRYRAPASAGLVFGAGHVYTAFHTCEWMPCAGPDLSRASVDIRLELPAGFRSVASGRSVGDPGGTEQRWQQARPYPLYSFGFAAGRFSESFDPSGDRRLRFLGAGGEDAAALHARFGESARVLTFLEEKAGVALPHEVYTQLLVPGDAAQEASSFSVIGRRAIDPILQAPEEDWVIVHEMAHQWWGDLVTCASWNELWLNEGIAVFLTAAWNEHRRGRGGYQKELALARQRWQRAKDAGFDMPLAWAGDYPNAAIRRAVQYSKGALFMHALREELGEPAFWAGLRGYTQDNAGRGVVSRDLQSAMEKSAGRSLQAMFERWVY